MRESNRCWGKYEGRKEANEVFKQSSSRNDSEIKHYTSHNFCYSVHDYSTNQMDPTLPLTRSRDLVFDGVSRGSSRSLAPVEFS